MLSPEVRDLERFFTHPGADALGPGVDGQACANVRHALLLLGYPISHGRTFDGEVEAALLAFQTDNDHKHLDGRCGSGTRLLLIRRLFETGNEGFFNPRAPEPVDRKGGGACFVSYSQADAELVDIYVDLIRAWGFLVWIDRDNIQGGADWKQSLVDNIDGSYVAMAFLTQSALKSRWCRFEAQQIARRNKPALALRFASAPSFHWARGHLLSKRFQQLPPPPTDVLAPNAAEFRSRLLKSILAHQQNALSALPGPPPI
jgi:TIR domain